jgi:hypothetical protein
MAVEIDDVVADWMLATKLVTIKVTIAEKSPELGFGRGLGVAVVAGVLKDGWVDVGFVCWWHKTLSLTLSRRERGPDLHIVLEDFASTCIKKKRPVVLTRRSD